MLLAGNREICHLFWLLHNSSWIADSHTTLITGVPMGDIDGIFSLYIRTERLKLV